MDSLDCKICHTAFDEEKYRPQLASCGHGLCSVCLKALVVDKKFVCPKCRKENIVNALEDIPINFDLIDVIRSFKAVKISLASKTQTIHSGASNDNMCTVHQKQIEYRCMSCPLWICSICRDSHSNETGCHILKTTSAMEMIKEEHSKNVEKLVDIFEDNSKLIQAKIKDNNEKIEKINEERSKLLKKAEQFGKEVTNMQSLLDKGKDLKRNLVESKDHLYEASSPFAMMDSIDVLAKIKQSFRSWSIKNFETKAQIDLLMTFEADVFIGMEINKEKKYGRLSLYEGKKCLHVLRSQNIPDSCTNFPFEFLQDVMSTCPTLVFMELTLGDTEKGRVMLRLYKHLPNIRKFMVEFFTGQQGQSLVGMKCDLGDKHIIRVPKISYGVIPTCDHNATTSAKRGEVL